MANPVKHFFKVDIEFDDVKIFDIEPKFRTDNSMFDMSEFFWFCLTLSMTGMCL